MPRLFTPDDMPPEVRYVIEALGNGVRTEILRLLSQQPQTALELAAQIGVAHSSVHRHLTQLEAGSFVAADTPREQRGGRATVRWTTNAAVLEAATRRWLAYATGGSVGGGTGAD